MTGPGRVVPQPHRAGRTFLEGLRRDVAQLQRGAIRVDEQGRVRIGPLYIIATENDDGSVTVQLQNANTESTPYTLARLP